MKTWANHLVRYFRVMVILLVLISIFFLVHQVQAESQTVTASVTIINPLGPDVLFKAVPEKRIGNILDRVLNRSTQLKINMYASGAERIPANVLWTNTSSTNDQGRFFTNLGSISQGTYDFTGKGYSHLTRLVSGVEIAYTAIVDFTDNGTKPLLAGDVNSTFGDDEVNALDVSILVNAWNTSNERADLNRDEEVNSIDISNLLTNFNETGD